MPRVATKFAVPLNTSVRKETKERAVETLDKWQKINRALVTEGYQKEFRMSDLAEIVWNVGLEVLEKLEKDNIIDTISSQKVNEETVDVEVKRIRKSNRIPKTLSQMSDEDIKRIVGDSEQ